MSDVARLFRHRRLHHAIEDQVLPHLRANAWHEAFSDAFTGLETHPREAIGSDSGYGTVLIDNAFRPGSGALVDPSSPVAE